MPFIRMSTNVKIREEQAQEIKRALGEAIALLPGKSERWLMVQLLPGQCMYFQGSDAPCAMAEIAVYGSVDEAAGDRLTGRVTGILSQALGIPADRIYVSYRETELWGWNGTNF